MSSRSPAQTRREPGGSPVLANSATCPQRTDPSPLLTYLASREPAQPICCCTTLVGITFFIDGITIATFDEVYTFGWRPGDAQAAA
ncbi:unannotated protein [freshwater metagenome]|uniref:Unannotated protein n=1 Tax=freshwater metagenome TaxID=449393 RepID=A0A6J6UP16_9ZZZZ